MFAEIFDGGQHVGAGRQQPALAEGAEDAGVVGGGGAQVEEAAFGGGDVAGLPGVPSPDSRRGCGTPVPEGRPSRSARRGSAAIDAAARYSSS
ncbi:hypothetical protein [Streptomyces sp. MBT67]|uniref:hypothetical protein n=1 Tax=Streptomyces sp. MBT67 TaxID=1488397 RepID=UPI0035B01195